MFSLLGKGLAPGHRILTGGFPRRLKMPKGKPTDISRKNPTNSPPVDTGHRSANCNVCKHPETAEIERLYIQGFSTIAISAILHSEEHKVSPESIHHHAVMTGLVDKRSAVVLSSARLIIDRAGLENSNPTVGEALKAMEMVGKITGEIKDRLDISGSILTVEAKRAQLKEQITTNVMERSGLPLQKCEKCRKPMSGTECVYCEAVE